MKHQEEHIALTFLRSALIGFPNAWDIIAGFRKAKGKNGFPDWSDWCYCPLAGAYAVVSGGGNNTVPIENMHFVGTLGALAAWRMTKGIYRFDKTVMDSLIETKIDGELPVDVLFKLPEWCIYIETPGMNYAEKNSHGMFVYLEEDVQAKRPELRFVFLLDDTEIPTIQAIIHLHKATLNECLGSVAGAIKMNMIAKGHFDTSAMDTYPKQAMIIEPFLSLVLYLCTQNAEITSNKGDSSKPENPKPVKIKGELKEMAAVSPKTWDVAIRLGAALRSAQETISTQSGGGTHASPRPHIRRAHWHTYLIGTGRTERILKWLPPIAVNIDDENELPATIRKVGL